MMAVCFGRRAKLVSLALAGDQLRKFSKKFAIIIFPVSHLAFGLAKVKWQTKYFVGHKLLIFCRLACLFVDLFVSGLRFLSPVLYTFANNLSLKSSVMSFRTG